MFDFNSLIGKTIESTETWESESFGTTGVTLKFTDGSEITLKSRGCDEGGWLDISEAD